MIRNHNFLSFIYSKQDRHKPSTSWFSGTTTVTTAAATTAAASDLAAETSGEDDTASSRRQSSATSPGSDKQIQVWLLKLFSYVLSFKTSNTKICYQQVCEKRSQDLEQSRGGAPTPIGGGVGLHRGSLCTSHPVALGLIHGVSVN